MNEAYISLEVCITLKGTVEGKEIDYPVNVYRDEDGFCAEVVGLEGCWTQASAFPELIENIKDAAELYLSVLYS